MAKRVDAIDPGLSRERVVSRRATGWWRCCGGHRTGCANRTTVGGESLSALIAVIKFENLPDPPPTKILRLRISNRPGLRLVLPRAQADYFQALWGARRSSRDQFSKNRTFISIPLRPTPRRKLARSLSRINRVKQMLQLSFSTFFLLCYT